MNVIVWGQAPLYGDAIYLKSGTLAVPILDRTYDVTVHAGSQTHPLEQMTVTIEGTQYDLPDTVAGEFIATTFQDIAVGDRELTFFFDDLGGFNDYMIMTALEIIEDPSPPLTLSITADSIREDGMTTATVSREDTSGLLVVDLLSNKMDEATVPAEVTIPDGATTSDPFAIFGQPDSTHDPDETVTISALADGFTIGTDSVIVTNIDPAPEFEAHYDFGPFGSPVATGFEMVTHTNPIWQPGADDLGSTARSLNDPFLSGYRLHEIGRDVRASARWHVRSNRARRGQDLRS